MHFVTTYTFKPHMTKEQTKDLLDRFAAVGEAPGTTSHYVWADGRGGTILGETDDLTAVYRNLLEYAEWTEFDVQPVLPVDVAVTQVMDYAG